MKYLLPILVLFLISCEGSNQDKAKTVKVNNPVIGTVYGNEIDNANILPASALSEKLNTADESSLSLEGNIDAVCQMTGCWMDVEMEPGKTVHVTFKDEAFTLPKDVAGKKVVFKGIAKKEITPVDLLKKQAADEGLAQEEIDAIKTDRIDYYFEADGVTIK